MSLIQRGGPEGQRIRLRLRALPPDDIATTIISYEEQMRGWMARLARITDLEQQQADYSDLKRLLRNYCNLAVLDFDEEAAAEFSRLQAAKIRIGTMDLKIAAITLSRSCLLLTRNMSHFGKVPSLHAEDWSA
jgi:tRNA(fMet)-specific endonuclease VapC